MKLTPVKTNNGVVMVLPEYDTPYYTTELGKLMENIRYNTRPQQPWNYKNRAK